LMPVMSLPNACFGGKANLLATGAISRPDNATHDVSMKRVGQILRHHHLLPFVFYYSLRSHRFRFQDARNECNSMFTLILS
jgi:hypothetical protein